MNSIFRLSAKEINEIQKYPALVSLLAASENFSLDEAEKIIVIKLTQTKSFSGESILSDFYYKAVLSIENIIDELETDLPLNKILRKKKIKSEIQKLEKILQKTGKEYSKVFHESMQSFTEHVLRAHHNVVIDFILPISIPGLIV